MSLMGAGCSQFPEFSNRFDDPIQRPEPCTGQEWCVSLIVTGESDVMKVHTLCTDPRTSDTDRAQIFSPDDSTECCSNLHIKVVKKIYRIKEALP